MNSSGAPSLLATKTRSLMSEVSTFPAVTKAVSGGFSLGTGQVFVANILGALSSVIFMVMYFPQFWLNHTRRSTQGFSSTGIIIKLVGASFLSVNAFVTGETLAVVLYGALGMVQHQAFMVQFFLYEPRNNLHFVLWILFPFVPFLLAEWLPFTMMVTSYIKPVSQVLSHIPQLMECHRLKGCGGVSLWSQHLNFVGGLMGVYMCWVIPPRSPMPWMLYFNSIGQAVTLYAMWLYYDSGFFGRSSLSPFLPLVMENEKRL